MIDILSSITESSINSSLEFSNAKAGFFLYFTKNSYNFAMEIFFSGIYKLNCFAFDFSNGKNLENIFSA